MSGGEEEEDLYGDLDSAPVAKKLKSSSSTAAAAAAASSASSTVRLAPLTLHGIGKVYDEAHVADMQKQIDTLRAENEALKRNMGTLYRTAKAELARKDDRIATLQDQIDATGS
mmetsp:Transcript_13776/g.29951  ORF Transcript_13776/g.29951 Transcript_13776/m.29951 type:complete len:114 (-) Transcript_13776:252-593(-)